MGTKNPRINVVLEKRLYLEIQKLAKQEGISLSMITRDLIREAMELREDFYFGAIAERRSKALKQSDYEDSETFWKNEL